MSTLHKTAFWLSLAANPTADPRNHLGMVWPKYTAASRQFVMFGNATGPGPTYVAPKEHALKYAAGDAC